MAFLINTGRALAQTEPSVDQRGADSVERVKGENEKIYKWIKLQIETPKRQAETKPAQAAIKATAMARKAPASEPASAPAATVATSPDEGPKVGAAPKATPAAADQGSVAATASPKPVETSPAEAVAATPDVPPPDEDPPLVLVHKVEPDYPPALTRRLQNGWVQVRFEVQPDGSVKQPEIENSSHVKLNAAALQAVAQWRFLPVRRTQYGIVELSFDAK